MSATNYLEPEMNRREFVASTAAAMVGGSAVGVSATPVPSSVKINLAADASAKSFPFSVMLWTVAPKLPFDQRIAKVSEAGYHAVELVEEYKDWGKNDFAAARKQFQQLGIVVDACSGIHGSLCDPAQRDALLAEIRAKLPVLAELECSRLILLTGNQVPGLSREKMHANCVEALKRAADVVAPQKVELLLENIDPEENPKYFLTSVAEGFQVIREVGNPHVRFLYDFFHEQIAEGNLISKLEKNLDLTGLVHIADVPGRHEPGTGEINYATIFRKLGQLGYSRYVAMEFIPTGDVVTSLRAAREFAEKYANEGRAVATSLTASEEGTYASS
jgi:hydroxypyruvate isomerase